MLVYLDNSATTKQAAQVTEAMVSAMEENYGNPSSLHHLGVMAEKALKGARAQVAGALHVSDAEVYFTSGGTEADNIAIRGSAHALRRKGRKLITSQVEHPAVLETFKALEQEGFQPVYLGVDDKGLIDMEELKAELTEDTILVSLMQVNNELGTVEPVLEVGRLLHGRDRLNFHVDAVQAFGKLPMGPVTAAADLVTVSAHKIHGPKGAGALYMKKGAKLKPPITGGGQERNIRSGTENVPGIIGFGAAAAIVCDHLEANAVRMKTVRQYLLDGMKAEIGDIRINSFEDDRCVPSVLNVSFLGVRGEVLLHDLERSQIYVSTGSACSSNKKGQSHVLKAAGLTQEEIEGAIRFSFSHYNTVEEMDYVLIHLKKAVESMRKVLRRG